MPRACRGSLRVTLQKIGDCLITGEAFLVILLHTIERIMKMMWVIFICLALACVSIVALIVVYHESKREDIVIIDDRITRGYVKKFLNLTEREQRKAVGERDG